MIVGGLAVAARCLQEGDYYLNFPEFPFNLADVLRAYGFPDLSQVDGLRGSTAEALDEAI